MKKVVHYTILDTTLQLIKHEDEVKPKHFIGIPIFASGQMIYNYLKLNRNTAPFLTSKNQEYIFSTTWQMLIDSLIYDDFKTILLDAALVVFSIGTSQ